MKMNVDVSVDEFLDKIAPIDDCSANMQFIERILNRFADKALDNMVIKHIANVNGGLVVEVPTNDN